MTTQIRVLGPGCARCQRLYENTTKAVAEMGLDANVEKVDDIGEIVRRGILATPALVVDEELVLAGHVPSTDTLREVLAGRRQSHATDVGSPAVGAIPSDDGLRSDPSA